MLGNGTYEFGDITKHIGKWFGDAFASMGANGVPGTNMGISESPMGETPTTANGNAFAGDDNPDYNGSSAEESQARLDELIKKQEEWMQKQNQFNHDEAELNRQWQEQMRGSQYQTMMQDLEKAGINPTLLFGGGLTAAGAPGGSTAHSGTPNVPGMGDTQVSREKYQFLTSLLMGIGLFGSLKSKGAGKIINNFIKH